MNQIIRITVYLLIALMSMGITGCPSDPLASNEVCSGQAPQFKLYVVSDTDAPFEIEVQSVGRAVHKTTNNTTVFNPITGVGPTYVYKTSVNRKGDIINIPFKPTDIHKNKGCIKDYSVSVDVTSQYKIFQKPSRTSERELLFRDSNLRSYMANNTTSTELTCNAPPGKQIKTCLFQVTVGEEVKTHTYGNADFRRNSRLQDIVSRGDVVALHRAIVNTTAGGETSRLNTFANE
jgi:hypothetical protein